MSDALNELNRLWGTRAPAVVRTPQELPVPSSIWEWALGIAERDEKLVGTAMRNAFKSTSDEEEGMIYAARGNAPEKIRKTLIQGVQEGAAIQLQVNWIEEKIPELAKFIREHLDPVLRRNYPFGWSMSASMFVTGSAHVYNAHCDLEDGVLFQLLGRKVVRCWGPSPEWFQLPIYDLDHYDKPHLFAGEVTEFELTPGTAIYFPAGAMHEISIPEGEKSVSIGLRPTSCYPIVEVVKDINKKIGAEAGYTLPEEAQHWFKFKAKFFEPSRYSKSLDTEEGRTHMPDALKKAFLHYTSSSHPELEKKLPERLDQWWAEFAIRKNHCPTGGLPIPPPDREEILARWEEERRTRRKHGNPKD